MATVSLSHITDDTTLRDPESTLGQGNISSNRNQLLISQVDPYLHATDRNGLFRGLSSKEREHIRCVEYQAVKLLAYIVPAYFVTFQLFGCLALGVYMAGNKAGIALTNGQNPWYVTFEAQLHTLLTS